MYSQRHRNANPLVWLSFAIAALWIPETGSARDSAHFVVKPDIINADLAAFTATIERIGNGDRFVPGDGRFEPKVFRNMVIAEGDSDNQIILSPSVIDGYKSWRQGALDGAEVEVLRITNGKMETVRRSHIAAGGFRTTAWIPVFNSNKVVPATDTSVEIGWDSWNRMGADEYYMVRAVDASGALSPASAAVSVTVPVKAKKPAVPATLGDVKYGSGDSNTLLAPTGVSARILMPQTMQLSWDPVPGAQGYVVYRSDIPPDQIKEAGIYLEDTGAPIRSGDMVLIRKTFRLAERDQVVTNRVWDTSVTRSTFGNPILPGFPGDPGLPQFRLVDHACDPPVPDAGETYLQVDLEGKPFAIGGYNNAGTDQDYYLVLQPNKTYRFDVWLRAKGAVSATFALADTSIKPPELPARFQVGPTWQQYRVDFTIPVAATSKQAGRMLLTLAGTGQVDIDNFRIYEADAPFSGLVPEDRAALAASGMEALRTHAYVRTGVATYDLNELTAAVGSRALAPILAGLKSLDMNPWLQIEPHLSREEWLGLMEYLAAPFDPAHDDPQALPWAAKRVAQGQRAPWFDEFDHIYFEIGNETWNNLFRPWVFPEMRDGARFNFSKYNTGQVYGLFQEHVLGILQESPWWDTIKPRLIPVIGGWAINNYGVDAMKMSPNSQIMTVAAYIGGWDSGEGPVRDTPQSFASVMAYAPQAMQPNVARYNDIAKQSFPDRNIITGTYESGPGYVLNGLNNQVVTAEEKFQQERVMKSAAAGTATLDGFLTRAAGGDRIQNFFTFGRGPEWKSHAAWYNGGHAYPSWDWLALFNREGLGDMLDVQTLEVPTRDIAAQNRRDELLDAPMAAAYATRNGDRLTVVVVSRQVPGVDADGDMDVTIDLPISGAQKITRYTLSGDYRSQNTTSDDARIEQDNIPVSATPNQLHVADLAPASAQMYVIEGAVFDE